MTCANGAGVNVRRAGTHCGHDTGAVAATGAVVPLCAPRDTEQDAL